VTVASVTPALDLVLDDGRRIRLAAIDPPDDPYVRAQARTALDAMIRDHPNLRIDPVAEPDRYGRVPAVVRTTTASLAPTESTPPAGAGEDLGAALVRAGLGRVGPQAGTRGCAPALLAAEAEARRDALGLWNGAERGLTPVRPTDAAAARRGRYVVVEGRIHSIRRGDTVTFVNLGPDFRRDFTILIPHKGTAGSPPFTAPAPVAIGRGVRIRGVVRGELGLSIRLDWPEQWEWTGS
jgi:endonuclease YncB( thermonuclease family)